MPVPTKLCALTFDDGPDPVKTERVLAKLRTYGVRATFFVVGSRLNEHTRPVLQKMLELGCELANHSWDYNSLASAPSEIVREKFQKTQHAIVTYAGMEARFFRPPNLAVSTTMYEVLPLPFVGGILGYDWAGCGTTAEDRAQRVLGEIADGAIILLHDVQPDPHPTPEALDILIPELQRQGFELVTLSELFARKGIDPASRSGSMWKYVR
ncbi:MAG: polysaccharide deacetylase family protein [Termitinemataceae bacterium]